MDTNNAVTTQQAAEILGVTPRRVRAMIKAGRLSAITVGSGPHSVHLISREALKLVKDRKAGRPKGSKNQKPKAESKK